MRSVPVLLVKFCYGCFVSRYLRMVLSENAAEGSAAAVEFSVNMTCGSCAKKIRDALLKADVKSFEVCTFLI
jgi:hypothetical protein